MNVTFRSSKKRRSRLFVLLLVGVFYNGQLSDSHAADTSMAIAASRVIQVIAHRGASAERPECTLAAVKRAIEVGATAAEVDVRTSKDGHLFILHDRTLDRTTNGSGRASSLTLAELQRLDAGSHFDEKYRGERIPSLIEVAELCRGKINLFLDLKEQGERYDRQVASVIRQHGDPARTLVGPHSVEQARRFRELLPEAKQLGIMPSVDEIEAFAEAGTEFVLIWSKWLTEGNGPVERVRAAGMKLHLNQATGELNNTLDRLVHQPVSIGTNDPKKFLETLRKIAAGRDS